jgi:tripartite-type tricarboxylate transporter receptor subunit TctC
MTLAPCLRCALLLAAAGTPATAVKQLNVEVKQVLMSAELKAAFLKEGAEPNRLTPA